MNNKKGRYLCPILILFGGTAKRLCTNKYDERSRPYTGRKPSTNLFSCFF